MAVFYPTFDKIKEFKVQPTAGEWALLNFLRSKLDDTFEVYFNPYLNGDRPDVIIMRKGYGVLIIEVKDWNINNFDINEKKQWIYTPNGSIVKSPVSQVLKYKENLYNLHVNQLLEQKVKDIRKFNIVACAVYFHCASQKQINAKLIEQFAEDTKYQTFVKYNVDLIGSDGLEQIISDVLPKRYLIARNKSKLFTDDIYDNFRRILSPSIHLLNSGIPLNYDSKQAEIIGLDKTKPVRLEQRVKGVFGSGKTTVLAARAVCAYKRALKRNNNPRILILTYNITLKNFIHDKFNNVYEEFAFNNFVIINYHSFINAELNNLNIEFEIPNNLDKSEISSYLERAYYSNVRLFAEHQSQIVKYDAVFIDEIQDYKREWMEIIKNYFRDPDGDYVLFGDVKQNIYNRPTLNKDVVTNVVGRPNELARCYRSDSKVIDVAHSFQKSIFGSKYEIDDFQDNGSYDFFGVKQQKQGYVNYMYLQDENPTIALYNIIRGNILNKNSNISPNDITILGYTTSMLRQFDLYYRYASREKTNCMIETVETMYMTHLNYINKNKLDDTSYAWFKNICNHLGEKLYPNKQYLTDDNLTTLRQKIAVLFSLYDLYASFGEVFASRLEEECQKCGISKKAFCAYITHYEEPLSQFREEVYKDNYKYIRDNKKIHFWMNSGTIKISTINSFKGWESEVVFLIIEPKYDMTTLFNVSFDELLYTGLTRCRRNLIVINFGNNEYDGKIRPLIENVK